jgi:hypothetical protein
MSVKAVRALIAVSVLTALLSACASPVETIGASPGSVELRWYKYDADFDQAQSVAQAYCGERARRPVLGDTFTDQDVSIATFRCD